MKKMISILIHAIKRNFLKASFYLWTTGLVLSHNIFLKNAPSDFSPVIMAILLIPIFLLMALFILSRALLINDDQKIVRIPPVYLFLSVFALLFLTESFFGVSTHSLWSTGIIMGAGKAALSLGKTIFITTLFFLSALAMGQKIYSFFLLKNSAYQEDLLFSFGLGIIFLSFFAYLLSVLNLAYSVMAYALILSPLALFFPFIRGLWHKIKRHRIEIILNKKRILETLAVIFIFFILFINLIDSLSGILGAQWDTFHQYLTFPVAYSQNHRLIPFLFHPHWGFPQSTEMIFLLGILIGGIEIPFLMNFIFSVLAFWGMYKIISGFGKKNVVWIMSIILSIPLVIVLQRGYLKVEMVYFFYLALVFLTLKKYLLDMSKKYLILAAVFIGFSFTIKYTSIFFIGGIILVALALKKEMKLNFKKIFLFSLIIMGIYIPWGIKNIIYYRNPFYPILSGGTDRIYQETGLRCQSDFLQNGKEDMFLAAGNSSLKRDSSILSNALLSFKILLFGEKSEMNDPGPWIAILLPFIIYYALKTKDLFVKSLGLIIFSYFIFWIIFLSSQVWYLLPSIMGCLLIAGYLIEKKGFIDAYPMIKFFIVIWLTVVISASILFGNLGQKIKYLRGEIEVKEAFWQMYEGKKYYNLYNWYNMWRYIDFNILKSDNKRLIYGFLDTQGYFIRDSYKNFVPDFFGYINTCLSRQGDYYDSLKGLGVKFVLFDENFYNICNIENKKSFNVCEAEEKFKNLTEKHGHEIHREGKIILYELE